MKKVRDYKFKVGQKVRIYAGKTPSVGVAENAGKIVTIKALCPFTWAYYLEEFDNLWNENCLRAV